MRIAVVRRIFAALFISCLSGWARAEPVRIDLLMVYSPAVLATEGSAEAVKAKIQALVAFANAAYARSDAGVVVRLLDVRQVNYQESGDGQTDLDRMIAAGDGYMDEVLLWRDQLGADVVGMMMKGGGGVGKIPTGANDSEKAFGFWIGNPQEGGDARTLAHELAHVMGSGHHLENPYNRGKWDYSHGQVSVGQNYAYADIMVSSGGLPAGVTGIPEPYAGFSNPRVYVDGVATGTAEGNARAADNARTIRQMAPLVAAYRPEKAALVAPLKPQLELDQALVMLKAPGFGASFSARVEAAVYPALQWQYSDDLGLSWHEVEDSLTVSGSRTANLSIAAVDAAAHGRQFRLLATNSSGNAVSGIATLLLNTSAVSQQVQTSFIDSINNWQEIVSPVNFIHAIDVPIAVTGRPPVVTAMLETLDGELLARTQVSVSALIQETPMWISLLFNVAVEANQKYRLHLSMEEDGSGAYSVRWRGSLENPYAQGRAKFSSDTDLGFRLYGANQPAAMATHNLQAGWHLLGNGTLASIQVASQYGDASRIESVWRWDTASARWRIYLPSLSPAELALYAAERGADVLSTLESGEAYWVHHRQAYAMPLAVAVPREAVAFRSISSGWHMVSIGSAMTPQAFHQSLGSAEDTVNFSSLWVWDNGRNKWYYYSPTLAALGGSVLADYAQANGMLDFASEGKLIEAHMGIWLYR